MPRLRRVKRELLYEELFPTDTWPKRGHEETADDESLQTSNQAGEFPLGTDEPTQQRGWYSNDAIITTMPDQKLREAYQRYKTLAELCQQEITRRRVTGSSIRATAQFDVSIGMHRFVPVGREDCYYQRAERRAKKTRRAAAGQLALTPQQMLSALQMLLTLKKQGQP